VGYFLMRRLEGTLISLGYYLCGPIWGVDKPSLVGRRFAQCLGVGSCRDAGQACRRGAHLGAPPTRSADSTPNAAASLRTVRG
jgi:hypothetical protein